MELTPMYGAGSVKTIGTLSIGLMFLGGLAGVGSLLASITPDNIPGVAVASVGVLGAIWAVWEFFRGRSEKIHRETEDLLRNYLSEARTEVRSNEVQYRSDRKSWEAEREKLVVDLEECRARVASLGGKEDSR